MATLCDLNEVRKRVLELEVFLSCHSTTRETHRVIGSQLRAMSNIEVRNFVCI